MGIYLDMAQTALEKYRPGVDDPATDQPDNNVTAQHVASYTDHELMLLADVPDPLRATVDAIKAVFADTGGATVIDVLDDPTWPRRQAAKLICQARLMGNHDQAVALRDGWRERVAICVIDGRLPEHNAEMVAAEEIRDLPLNNTIQCAS